MDIVEGCEDCMTIEERLFVHYIASDGEGRLKLHSKSTMVVQF